MSSLRLNRSASLPQIGVEIAVVSSVAVTTHVKAAWSPPMSWMMTGSEVETTVAARIETNMPSRRPDSASSTLRCDMRRGCRAASFSGFAGVVVIGGHGGPFRSGELTVAVDVVNYMRIG